MYKQNGAALVLSLVILLILTLLGVTAMNTATTQDILVRNLQDAMINKDCSETILKNIHDQLATGTMTVNGGDDFDININAPLQNVDTDEIDACAESVTATFQYAGDKELHSATGQCTNQIYEISVDVESPSGGRTVKTYGLRLPKAKC